METPLHQIIFRGSEPVRGVVEAADFRDAGRLQQGGTRIEGITEGVRQPLIP